MKALQSASVALLAALFSASAGSCGARVAGLRENGLGLQFVPVLLFGFIGGLLIYFVTSRLVRRLDSLGQRVYLPLIGAPVLVALAAFVICYIPTIPGRRHEALQAAGEQRLKTDPLYIHQLVHGARAGTLQPHELSILRSSISTRQEFTPDELTFLIRHYEDDGSALGALIAEQALSAEQLGELYTRSKAAPSQHRRVLMEMTDLENPPVDILEDISKDDQSGYAKEALKRLNEIKTKVDDSRENELSAPVNPHEIQLTSLLS